ncbi:hypothetical protein K1Y77_17125 (plasmid) [Halomonas qaidamensis]|uniref:HTH luxR-type domain-containing protein n=1 Tax=Halomonas qaidamensis TaxID=2866211 RepID=A0ABY6JYW1_9GAMM|nr:hypothetical protein [Halomonas qaidamensis]UYV20942.1 hypothetical protein K1Y77_17125 [Halomonas qaidamensis]
MNNTAPRQQWRDDDVIGHPSQHLTPQEIAHLVALANGNAPSAITVMHGTSRTEQQQLERGLRAKLGAQSKPHMITRAFVLGVLLPRALCLMLAALSINASPGDLMAIRAPKPSRSPVSSQRNVRSHRAMADAYALPAYTLQEQAS